MSTDHPLLLTFAVLMAVAVAPGLARFFFGNREQFAEDLGLTTGLGRWALLMDYFAVNLRHGSAGLRGIWLNIIGFVVTLAAITAAAYYLPLLLIGASQ